MSADVSLPAEVAARLPSRSKMLSHAVMVDAARWARETERHGLPAPTGTLAEHEQVAISRADVFEHADADITAESALQLLYLSLAWGLGLKARMLRTRLRCLSEHDGHGDLLAHVWERVRAGADVRECYELLTTGRGAGRIRYFGPAFSTKYLYFAQGTTAEPRLLIMDKVTTTRLRAWYPNLATAGWTPPTYAWYCNLLAAWAEQAESRYGTRFTADQIEMALFTRSTAAPAE